MYRNNRISLSSQQGNVYIVAIFVIVVMGMLALNLTRISWSNQDTLTREVLGSQASFLAQSGNEWALTHLFPLDQDDDHDSLVTRCSSLGNDAIGAKNALVANSGVACTAPDISCVYPFEDNEDSVPDELKYIQVSTRAICNDGNVFVVEREETVWVRGVKGE
ncbi:hypothetical protein [Vibrio breoganii]|uniref:hypothetical protein n=1 Tax=Vibrio breoganii TaxID=553239 RepID=UPI000C8170B5|nr:hypothetical protein [Vibrio breoganii]PML11774.1 hypothetical protein BCT84_03300 [Vibrio breoganii]